MGDWVRRALALAVVAGVVAATEGLAHAQQQPSRPRSPSATAHTLSGPELSYRSAREAMVRGDVSEAIGLFGQVASQYPNSKFAAAALYYRAFLQYRQYTDGSTAPLRASLTTLKQLERRYPDAPQVGDARSLRTRVCGELAQRGDEACREEIVAAAQEAMPSQSPRRMTIGPNPGTSTTAPKPVIFGSGTVTLNSAPDTSCRGTDRLIDNYIARLNSLWKIDSVRAMDNTSQILTQRSRCYTRARAQAVLMMLQRPTPVMGMAPSLFEAARNDPDPGVRNLATIWLLSQEWDPAVAKFLHATFGQSFRTKSSAR